MGAGIAGAMLAWRLSAHRAVTAVDLVTGRAGRPDASRLSGGIVRGFEPHPAARRLATASLAELLADRRMRSMAGFRRAPFDYLLPRHDVDATAVAEIDTAVPNSVEFRSAGTDARWDSLPADTVVLREWRAGRVLVHRWRIRLLVELAGRPRVAIQHGALRLREPDRTVYATGAWTPLLLDTGPDQTFRSKAIQYGVYRIRGRRPDGFVDALTGLYGCPIGRRELLLGLPSDRHDVAGGVGTVDADHQHRVEYLAGKRFPWLRWSADRLVVAGSDCYVDPPVLALRPVPGRDDRVHTFTGGSGGAAKSVLAASRIAARQLLGERT